MLKNAKTYAELDAKKKDLENRLSAVKRELAQIEEQLLDEMSEEGVPSLKINIENSDGTQSTRTVYQRRELWAGYAEDFTKQDLCEALKHAGLEDMVTETFNTNTLSAYIREYDENNQSTEEIVKQLPAEIQPYIKVSEKYKIRTRKS